ncbi:MAG: hypothetical protein R2878_05065 [Thermoleophilia bacterium]
MKDSPSSTEQIAGFRIVRRLGDSVWEAVQPELGRRVALRRLEPDAPFRPAAWPDRPGVVDLFAVVDDASGTYIATRFVPGARTFAELSGTRAARQRGWLDQVSAILADTVHGDLTAHDILIDPSGRPHVTGFGRGPGEATADDDRAAIARLRPEPTSPARTVALGAGGVAAVLAAVVLLGGPGGESGAAPAVAAGATAYGSALGAGPVTSVDCEDRPAGGDSVACTILQGALPGRTVAAAAPGRVRAWVVQGVRGRVRLQVLRPVDGRLTAYANAALITIPDRGVHVVAADLEVPAGARFGLEVAPGSEIGIRNGVDGAQTLRFYGPLRGDRRSPAADRGAGQELLLRVDVVPGG